MNLHNLSLKIALVLALLTSFALEAADSTPYTLQHVHHDDKNMQSSAVYFDEVRQRLVVKTLKWDEHFEKARRKSGTARFEFPSEVRSLASINSKVLKDQHNVSANYSYIDLGKKGDKAKAKRELSDLFPKGKNDPSLGSLMSKLSLQIIEKPRFRKVYEDKKNGKDFAIYYNRDKGEFVLKGAKRKTNEGFLFPAQVGLHSEVDVSGTGFRELADEVYPARTYSEFMKALDNIKDEMRSNGFNFNPDIFAPEQSRFFKDLEEYQFVRQNKSKTKQVFFNSRTNQLVYRHIKTNSKGGYQIKEEAWFDLSDQDGFSRAKRALVNSGLYNENEFEQYRGAVAHTCEADSILDYLSSPHQYKDYADVTDRLFEKYLEGAVSKTAVALPNNNVNMGISLLDKDYNIQVKMNKNGEIEDIFFLNPQKDFVEGLRVKKEVDDQGRNYFVIEAKNPATGEIEPFMVFSSERNGRNEKGEVEGNIAVYVRGKKAESEFDYDDYEKSIYPFTLSEKENRVTEIGPRERINEDSPIRYEDNPEVDDGGGLTGFFFKLVYGKEGRREKVRDELAEKTKKALSSGDYKNLIKEKEIDYLSDIVSKDVGKRTNNYKDSLERIKAVATEEGSNTIVVDTLLPRMLADLLPNESEEVRKELAKEATVDFRSCLAAASKAANSKEAEECLNDFLLRGGVDVADAVLKRKLKEAGLENYAEYGSKKFRQCAREHYFTKIRGFDLKDGEATLPEDAMPTITGCIYKSFLETTNHAAPNLIDWEVEVMSEEMGLKLSINTDQKKNALSAMNKCFTQKGFLGKKQLSFKRTYNFAALKTMEGDSFQHNILRCVDDLKGTIGRDITKTLIAEKFKVAEGLSEEVQTKLRDNALENGYDKCVQKQYDLIDQAIAEYDKRKANGEKTPDTYIPSLDPGGCTAFITNLAVGATVQTMIEDKIGKDLWDKLLKDPESYPGFLKCFEKQQTELEKQVAIDFINPSLSDPKIRKAHQQAMAKESDKKTAECAKEAIVWASYHATGMTIEEKLSANPEYKDIKFGDKEKAIAGEIVRECFKKGLAEYDNLDDIVAAQKTLENKCGVEMLKNEKVQDFLFKPAIKLSLLDAKIKEEDAERISKILLKDMSEHIKDETSIDDVMKKAESFKPKAILKVVNILLEDKINEMVSSDQSGESEETKKILESVNLTVLNEKGYKKKIEEASLNPDKTVLTGVIDDFKEEATYVIAGELAGTQGEKLLEEGIFDSQEDIEELEDRTVSILKECILQAKAANASLKMLWSQGPVQSRDSMIESCANKAKNETTFWVFETQLNEKMDDMLSAHTTAKERRKIAEKLLNEDFLKRIKKANANPDSEQSKRDFSLVTEDFKLEAAREITSVILPKSLETVMKYPIGASEATKKAVDEKKKKYAQTAVSDFEACLDTLKKKNEKHFSKENAGKGNHSPEKELNTCINQARLNVTNNVLDHKLGEILDLIDPKSNLTNGIIAKVKEDFQYCFIGIPITSNVDVFKAELEACAIETTLSFTDQVIPFVRNSFKDYLKPREETEKAWKACVAKIKDKAIEKLKKQGGSADVIEKAKKDSGPTAYRGIIAESFKIVSKNNLPEKEAIGIAWMGERIKECSTGPLGNNLTLEYRDFLLSDKSIRLNEKEKEVIGPLLTTIGNLLQTTGRDENPVKFSLDIKYPKSKDDKKPSLFSLEDGGLALVKRVHPELLNILRKFARSTDPGVKKDIKDLERALIKAADEKGGEIKLSEMNEVLLKSKLLDRFLLHMMSEEVNKAAGAKVREQGGYSAFTQVMLREEKIVERVLDRSNPEAAKLLDKIKKDYLAKLLNGEINAKDKKPEWMLKETQILLAKDKGPYGNGRDSFAEAVMYGIVQKNLDDELRDLTNGSWGSEYIKMSAAGWMGYNIHRFRWKDGNYQLRYNEYGRRGIEYFRSKILLPMSEGNLSDSQMVDRKETLTDDYIKKAMKGKEP